jgi:glycosyltransferase involved in cell wall biosynthesis
LLAGRVATVRSPFVSPSELPASASQEVPNVELAILGDGELRDETAARAQIALGERARLLGHRSDVPSVLPALDVFAMTSDFEGLPFALL